MPAIPARLRAVLQSTFRFYNQIGLLFALTCLLLVGACALYMRSVRLQDASASWVAHTYQVMTELDALQSSVTEAESGQRGFVLTGRAEYLAPYTSALGDITTRLQRIQSLTQDNPTQRRRIPLLRLEVREKLDELAQTVALRRRRGFEAARRVVVTDRGRRDMDDVRRVIGVMRAEESRLLAIRQAALRRSARHTRLTLVVFLGTVCGLVGLNYGLVVRESRRRKAYEQELRAMNRQLEDQAVELEAQTEELEALNLHLEALALQDGLTGLANHRAFQERLAEEWGRAQRYGTPLAVVMLDVDRFKQYNDSFGHPAGDQVLRQVALLLRREARECDLVARYGGEEFALILPHTDRGGAAVVAERLRAAVAGARWANRPVTVSVGVASRAPGLDREAMIEAADRALYESKASGRNRVTCAAPPAALPIAA